MNLKGGGWSFGNVYKGCDLSFKDSSVREVLEDVFDQKTVLAVVYLMNKGILSKLYGTVSTGKEARVYWGKGRNGEDLAVKIYLIVTAEFRRGRLKYIVGDPRFQGASLRGRELIYQWARKEYRNLKRAVSFGIPSPKPIAVHENILVMEFIGEDGVPAPLLKDTTLRDPEKSFRELKGIIEKMVLEAEIIHADLSEYNILVKENDELVIIDWGSAVLTSHPNAREFLLNDIRNVYRFFKEELGVETGPPEDFYNYLATRIK